MQLAGAGGGSDVSGRRDADKTRPLQLWQQRALQHAVRDSPSLAWLLQGWLRREQSRGVITLALLLAGATSPAELPVAPALKSWRAVASLLLSA